MVGKLRIPQLLEENSTSLWNELRRTVKWGCEDCQEGFEGECEKHGPLKQVSDTEVGTRARISLPQILELKEGKIFTGIFAKEKLAKRLQFGPLIAVQESNPLKQITAENEIKNKFGIVYKLVQNDGRLSLLDTRSEGVTNWMIFVRPASKRSEQNLVAFQYQKKIYFATCKEIPAKCELKVWYSRDYGTSIGAKLLPIESVVPVQFKTRHKFNCIGCGAVFSSTSSLRNHQCPKQKVKPKPTELPEQLSILKKTLTQEKDPALLFGEAQISGVIAALSSEPSTSKTVIGKLGVKGKVGTKSKSSISKSVPTRISDIDSEVKLEIVEEKIEGTSKEEERSIYLCSVCNKEFYTQAKLKQHSYLHTGERPFSCPHCQKAFSSRFKLERHKLIHTGERQHQCPLCSRSFHRKDHLKNHIQIHDPNKQYKCKRPECGKEYNSYMSYRKHCAVHAAEDGDLECKICQGVYKTKAEVLSHLKVHVGVKTVKSPGEKKFPCDQCDRRFFTRKDVKRHMVVHTGQRDFICTLCPQKFGRKDHLIRHMKKGHGVSLPDFVRLEPYDPSLEPGPSTAPRTRTPESTSLSVSSAEGRPFSPSIFNPEALGDPIGIKSFVTPLQAASEQDYSPGTFPADFRFIEEVVKEEPELSPSVELEGGGDDISRMLGMYLPPTSSSLPSVMQSLESTSRVSSVVPPTFSEGGLFPISIPTSHLESSPLMIPISSPSVFGDPVCTLSSTHLLPASSTSSLFSTQASSFMTIPVTRSTTILPSDSSFSSLLEEDSSSLGPHDESSVFQDTATTSASSTPPSTTTSTSLPGFDQAFP